jgi:hypothetical protein
MISKNQVKAWSIILLMASFISQGCALQSSPATPVLGGLPTPTAIQTVTSSIPKTPITPYQASTSTLPAVPTETTLANLLTAAQIIVTAIETNQPEMLRSLISEEGVAPGGFAQGVDLKGYNNADEIVEAFDEALDQSMPVCEGFVPNAGSLPDKATLVYRDVELDWSRFDLSGTSSGGITLTLFKQPKGWRLIYITPFDFEVDLPNLGPLQGCPAPQPTNTETAVPLTPLATTEISNSQLNLSQMSVNEWASTSPNGRWVAVGLVAFPKANTGGQQAYVRFMIFSVDGKTHWTIIDKWQEMGLGFPMPEPLSWSQDHKHFYFSHRLIPDGCSAFPFLTDLQRVNLADGTVTELLPQSAVALALAPAESQVAYIGYGERGLVLRDLVTGEERETKIDPGKDFNVGNILWSPEGNALALTLAINPCTGVYGVSKTVWAESTTILWVDAKTLQQKVLLKEDSRLFITQEWNDPGKITITDGAENSLWSLNVDTGEIARKQY